MAPERTFGISENFKTVGRIDVVGGGQITVENGYAYVGHMGPRDGTTILDVSDPRNPRIVSHLTVPPGVHSHKVRVAGDIMLVNHERMRNATEPVQGGLKVYDISDRSKPREIGFFKTGGTGVHRFDFDGRHAYISPEMEGYQGNIMMILDIADPERPEEVSRWWVPGQHTAGGETPELEGRACRCHHPLRLGDRLYVSYWHAGFMILDIADLGKPKLLSRVDWSPPYPCPTHTALPLPYEIGGRRFLVVTDEEVPDRLTDKPNAFFWMVDITDETNPAPVSTYQVPDPHPFHHPTQFGAHQPQEQIYPGVYDHIFFVAWFTGGLRAVDISDPYRPKEVGYHVPLPGKGQEVTKTNDVFLAKDGLIYALDRLNGLDILEFTG